MALIIISFFVALVLILGTPLLILWLLGGRKKPTPRDTEEPAATKEADSAECEPDMMAVDPLIIKERTSIDFPPFAVERSDKEPRPFSRDDVKEAILHFEDIPLETYAQIRNSGDWETELFDNEVCYVCRHRDNYGFWIIRVYAERPEAVISYGK